MKQLYAKQLFTLLMSLNIGIQAYTMPSDKVSTCRDDKASPLVSSKLRYTTPIWTPLQA